MTQVKLVVASLLSLALMVCAGTVAFAGDMTYALPDETATLEKSADPGYEKARNTCSVCHSVDYITSQPRGKGKDFWTAEVKKMISVYGAPVADADRPAIIDYLSKTY
jgi:mono/diheme cytochrome c family protein